ncbi:MAG: rod shape-determining protein RodA [Patescibacteria group bacterium]
MDLRENFFRKFDWLIILPAFILSVVGLVAIYSTDLARTSSDFLNFKKQAITFVLGILVLTISAIINYRQLRNAKNILYLAGALLLVGVLIFGRALRGTTGWFVLGPLTFQPVEVVKIILVIFLAEYFSREGRNLFTFRDIFKSFFPAMIMIGLVMLQPDLGSSIILFLIWLGMLLVSRVQKKHLLAMFLIFISTAVIAWFFVLAPYQKDRIKVFINPDLDPLGSGYNIKQAIIAIGSGGFWGKGLGFGSQSQLRFLPETHTDFIFALIAEEMGFFITAIVLGLFALLFLRILSMAKKSGDNFTAYLCVGFLIIFASEAIINIGMNLGLMPVTGLALPFISLGGSSLLSKFLMIGILESARLRSP